MRRKTFFAGFSFLALIACLVMLATPQQPAAAMGDGGTTCEGDLNGDGFVLVDDLLAVLGDWGCTESCTGDANSDGMVDVQDVLVVIANFGACESGTACDSHADCDDGDPCTFDFCIDGNCVHYPVPDCE